MFAANMIKICIHCIHLKILLIWFIWHLSHHSAEHLIDEVPKKVEDKLKDLEEIAEGNAKPEWETTSQGVDQTSVPYSVVNLVLYNMLVQCVKEDVDLDQVLCWILATVAVRAGCSCLEQSIQKYPCIQNRDPHPCYGKCHSKFPFWLLEPLPKISSGTKA